MSSPRPSRSMDGREAAITVAPGRAAPGCGSVLAGGGGARGSGAMGGPLGALALTYSFCRRWKQPISSAPWRGELGRPALGGAFVRAAYVHLSLTKRID